MGIVPQHVGFIVDGNRRWAKERGLKPYEGHYAGYDALKEVIIDCISRGIPYVTAYVFSTENWKRNPIEVKKLMELTLRVFEEDLHIFQEHNIRLSVIGSRKKPLSNALIAAIDKAEDATKANTSGRVMLCLNYGGRQELVDAYASMMADGITQDDVTATTLGKYLYAPGVPDIDMVVRTSGEQRLSNFMIWRAAYSELMFIDKPWPDMTKADVTDILNEYKRRNRRFGG